MEKPWKSVKQNKPKSILESAVNLKTIITDGYYGTNGLLRPKTFLAQDNKKIEPLYQSSRLVNLSNIPINSLEER